jgi:hypothetical protein
MYCKSLFVFSLILLVCGGLLFPSCRGMRTPGDAGGVADPVESLPPIADDTFAVIADYLGREFDPPMSFPTADQACPSGRPSDFVLVPLPDSGESVPFVREFLGTRGAVWSSRQPSLLSGVYLDSTVFRLPYVSSVAFQPGSGVYPLIALFPETTCARRLFLCDDGWFFSEKSREGRLSFVRLTLYGVEPLCQRCAQWEDWDAVRSARIALLGLLSFYMKGAPASWSCHLNSVARIVRRVDWIFESNPRLR